MSNDRRQIELERAMRKIRYLYLRKRQSKGEAGRSSGRGQFEIITKDELAQAVAGCELDPAIVRAGKEQLFTEEYYSEVFPNSDPNYHLPKFHLMRAVTKAARGVPARSYAKWLVLYFVWSRVAAHARGANKSRAFRVLCEKQSAPLVMGLRDAIEEVFIESNKFYRANRGEGESALDVSQFFKNRKGHHRRFFEHWEAVSDKRKRVFDNCLEKVRDAILAFEG
jgi:hypothetical protein